MRIGRGVPVALASLGIAVAASAQNSIDQQNAADTNLNARCVRPTASLYQSFAPRITPLAAVALEVRLVSALGDSLHLRIRAGSPGGKVLAEAAAYAADNGWVQFDLPAPLDVAPGFLYVLEWVHPTGWVYNADDPYHDGWGFDCTQQPRPEWDFHFRTYAGASGLVAHTWTWIKSQYAEAEPGSGAGESRTSAARALDALTTPGAGRASESVAAARDTGTPHPRAAARDAGAACPQVPSPSRRAGRDTRP